MGLSKTIVNSLWLVHKPIDAGGTWEWHKRALTEWHWRVALEGDIKRVFLVYSKKHSEFRNDSGNMSERPLEVLDAIFKADSALAELDCQI